MANADTEPVAQESSASQAPLLRVLEAFELLVGQMAERVSGLDAVTVDLSVHLAKVDKKVNRLSVLRARREAESRYQFRQEGLVSSAFAEIKENYTEALRGRENAHRVGMRFFRRGLLLAFENWRNTVQNKVSPPTYWFRTRES